jgi:hypothetical protein
MDIQLPRPLRYVAVGALSGVTPGARSLFWFDAHGEANTPDTIASGFLDGMGLTTALGWCWRSLAASIPMPVSIRHDPFPWP